MRGDGRVEGEDAQGSSPYEKSLVTPAGRGGVYKARIEMR